MWEEQRILSVAPARLETVRVAMPVRQAGLGKEALWAAPAWLLVVPVGLPELVALLV